MYLKLIIRIRKSINSWCNLLLKIYYIFLGDIDDDEEVLDWLTDPSNMELTEHIEKVNRKMFSKIRQSSENVAVFFCEIIVCYLF